MAKRTRRRADAANPSGTHQGIHAANNETRRIAPDATHFNASESPLAWLARRKDSSGKPMIDAAQFAAGERFRADFTRAGLSPRLGANWASPVAGARFGASDPLEFSDLVISAKQRLRRALDAVGPEFSGVLLDVCCFLKGLETVERERGWPRRASKVVLSLGLDRLARHYGIVTEISGGRGKMRAWQAEGARPEMSFEP